MRFRVSHTTSYHYDRPVRLEGHRLRLTPRAGPGVRLIRHELAVDPEPSHRWQGLDPDGNLVTGLRFAAETCHLSIRSSFELCTATPGVRRAGFAPPSDAVTLKQPYGPLLRQRLAPWLGGSEFPVAVRELADALGDGAEDGVAFLDALNRHLHGHFKPEIRDAGAARPPEETLRLGRGACRDLAMLFLAVCRRHGWAGRFVSGYQARGHPGARRRHMHAWPEVYLPGVGWQGFDPTHGLPVGEAHVALAAAADPADAAPIEGSFRGDASSRLAATLHIEAEEIEAG